MSKLDYEVLKFLFKSENALKVGDISKKMDLPHSTLGSCIKRLNDEGYVSYKPYYDVKMTKKGTELTKEIYRHKHLIEVLLYNGLHLSKEKAHEESEKFNLILSCETINSICKEFGHPKLCPCGEIIPTAPTPNCHCKKKPS
jgi:DtxR family Mn-dependent transcriptional regulator